MIASKTLLPRLFAGVLLGACALAGARTVEGGEPPAAQAPSPIAPQARASQVLSMRTGDTAFMTIASVLQSPRCMNCHPAGESPLNGDHAARHRMNVSRMSMQGLSCQTCHRKENGKALHSPPGAPNWRVPPDDRRMVFEGKSAHDLCEQIKDPARNGDKSLLALKEHMGHDPFVLWAWSPGPGRTPPPISHDALMKSVDDWIAVGAPCPN
jgi:hypothetical protein